MSEQINNSWKSLCYELKMIIKMLYYELKIIMQTIRLALKRMNVPGKHISGLNEYTSHLPE